jgi:hypothetical protein
MSTLRDISITSFSIDSIFCLVLLLHGIAGKLDQGIFVRFGSYKGNVSSCTSLEAEIFRRVNDILSELVPHGVFNLLESKKREF